MIAIIGAYGVGKTTFLKKIESFGYKVLYSDAFFQQNYMKGYESYELIKKHLGSDFVDENTVLKPKLREFILNDPENINILEKLIYPVLERELSSKKYDFVEIPNLYSKNANFERYFSRVVRITSSEEKRQENIKKKNVEKSVSNLNNALNKDFFKNEIVEISTWNEWDDKKFQDFFELVFNM